MQTAGYDLLVDGVVSKQLKRLLSGSASFIRLGLWKKLPDRPQRGQKCEKPSMEYRKQQRSGWLLNVHFYELLFHSLLPHKAVPVCIQCVFLRGWTAEHVVDISR